MIPLPLLKSLLLNRYLWGVLLIGGLVYGAYAWAFARGAESRTPEVVKLTQERNEAKELLRVARDNAEGQRLAHATAMTGLVAEQAEVLKGIRAKLEASKVKAKILQEKLDAIIPDYVSPKADAACVVPIGFVRFHNLSAEAGAGAPASAQGLTIPSSRPADADNPSGVVLSTVANTVTRNYAECQARLEVIESWQTWYHGSLESWRKAVEAQGRFNMIVPLSRPSPPP